MRGRYWLLSPACVPLRVCVARRHFTSCKPRTMLYRGTADGWRAVTKKPVALRRGSRAEGLQCTPVVCSFVIARL
jgi:hypothetical protein